MQLMRFIHDSTYRLYRLRARRWTREIALAAILTAIALVFLGAAYMRGAMVTQSAGAERQQQSRP